jgi:hypothetical protein
MRPTIWFRAILSASRRAVAVAAQTNSSPSADGVHGSERLRTGPYSSRSRDHAAAHPRFAPANDAARRHSPFRTQSAPQAGDRTGGCGDRTGGRDRTRRLENGQPASGQGPNQGPNQEPGNEGGAGTGQPIVVDVIVPGNKKAALSKVYSHPRTRKGREVRSAVGSGRCAKAHAIRIVPRRADLHRQRG